MSFDVTTAFLHASLPNEIFAKQIPGFPEPDSATVLRLRVALYGLKQSSHEWYKLLSSTLSSLGLLRCEADHAVFTGRWLTPPHASIPLLPSGEPLFLIIPIHVDDGLAITNSLPIYLLNTNTYGNPARTEMTDTDTEDGGVHGGVKGAASTYVLCPHLTDGAFQFKRRERQERSG